MKLDPIKNTKENTEAIYESILEEVKCLVEQSKALYNDMRENELSFGMVEAEGAVRMGRTIRNRIEEMYKNEMDGLNDY